MLPSRVVLDTNVFVAAGFKRKSAAAHLLEQVRLGQLRAIWNQQTRHETKYILEKIPPLSWTNVEKLFRAEDCHHGKTTPEEFDHIPDPEDRKFAALAAATGAVLLTNDSDLLNHRDQTQVTILTPREYCDQTAANHLA